MLLTSRPNATSRLLAVSALLLTAACRDAATGVQPIAEAPSHSLAANPQTTAEVTTLFGPRRFVRATGAPKTETVIVASADWRAPVTLHVRSGDATGEHPVASGSVRVNGETLIDPSMLNRAGSWSFAVTPGATITLAVHLAGAPGGILDVWFDGVSEPPAVLSATMASPNFGLVTIGTAVAPRTITVTNTGPSPSAPLTVALSGMSVAEFGLDAGTCAGASLAPGASCTASVTPVPSFQGVKLVTFTATAGSASATVPAIQGIAVFPPPPVLSASIASSNFGFATIGAPAIPRTITVTNTGGSASTTLVLALSGSSTSEFQLDPGTCAGASLAAGGSCTATVTFVPTLPGAKVVTFTVSAGNVSASLPPFTGTATYPPPAVLSASISSSNFGAVSIGSSSAPRTITVSNTGGSPTSLLSLGLTGMSVVDYQLDLGSCAGVTLAAGASCEATVVFTPLIPGSKTATFTVTAGNLSSSLPVFTGVGY